MPLGFQHGDGWFDILWRLCEDLEPLVAEFEVAGGPKFEVLQVKEKFGGLRFYVNCRNDNDAIRHRILAAQEESFHTCEVCGQPGRLRREGRSIKTLCDEHASEEEKQVMAELTHAQLWPAQTARLCGLYLCISV